MNGISRDPRNDQNCIQLVEIIKLFARENKISHTHILNYNRKYMYIIYICSIYTRIMCVCV